MKFLTKDLQKWARIDQAPPYDWQFVLSESFNDGSACVHFGVVWYDLEFFLEKKDSFRDNRHTSILQNIGIAPSRISVDHWVRTK
ncbi:hypothetical protein BOR84_11645 [Corynebacterium striatum]|uniref:Uncharacterized protein n=1 Tax=Corynebacterium striatum TaxID=43770 RepID=A0ABC8CNA1_CORST|nr:hypothetical protein BBR43_08510 [Corynebacterium striatum]ATZ09358.1 hypothetical protein A9D01_11995 [Corynebacterium striatum]EGT5576144.1 hypothetical protein [Corynebacterium striatum]EGT5613465.1 hypothetical protein [Corynebacterium striatum]EGT5788441.1 hypothetical protein [Corynebacterium striatum]